MRSEAAHRRVLAAAKILYEENGSLTDYAKFRLTVRGRGWFERNFERRLEQRYPSFGDLVPEMDGYQARALSIDTIRKLLEETDEG